MCRFSTLFKNRFLSVKSGVIAFALLLSPLTESACAHPLPGEKTNSAKLQKKKLTCSVDNSGKLVIRYPSSGKRVSLKLDLPSKVKLSNLLFNECSEDGAWFVSSRFLVRTLGSRDVKNGKQMLGLFQDDSFFPQNSIAWDLKPLGKIIDVSRKGSLIIIQTGTGEKYGVDTDRPSEPAFLMK